MPAPRNAQIRILPEDEADAIPYLDRGGVAFYQDKDGVKDARLYIWIPTDPPGLAVIRLVGNPEYEGGSADGWRNQGTRERPDLGNGSIALRSYDGSGGGTWRTEWHGWLHDGQLVEIT